MFRMNQSISRKIMLTFALLIIVVCVVMSTFFYFMTRGVVNDNVVPQFRQVLNIAMDGILKDLDNTQVLLAAQGNNGEIMKLESYLNTQLTKYELDNLYVLHIDNDKAVVAATANSSKNFKDKQQVPLSDNMQIAMKQGKLLTDLYSTEHGTDMTYYYHIPGSDVLIAASMDASFVGGIITNLIITTLVVVILSVAVCLFVAYRFSRNITLPLARLVRHTRLVAEGNLQQDIKMTGSDEIAQLARGFRIMTENLRIMVNHVIDSSDKVLFGTEALSKRINKMQTMVDQSVDSITTIKDGSTMIASSSTENARAMEEITNGIQHIASSTADISDQLGQASEQAVSGNGMAQHAIEQMHSVEMVVSDTRESVQMLINRSEAISQILLTIGEITKQIQMLSLNASIEAARAGEHGRGFAVVAAEVRKLADQSRGAAQQIESALQSIREESLKSTESMNRVRQEVQSGAQLVQQAGQSFDQLVELVQQVNMTVQSASAATEEISAGSEQVSASVDETAQITQRALDNIQGIAKNTDRQSSEMLAYAAIMQELNEQAHSLQDAVSKFTLK
ncbi:HAMP domain-containing methyl-accepting chemotaxis protein [Paenibacillus campi]|uniref:methyl-accepting chemotaxis protein n=1 Tax=Paenibacillus campi TaxID=3106031 RepID=UPI002AFEE005|nr:HAMP domain-containing methyl-accepting chemotaxis protein [Paenibacillus sp. SGZ-1014]